MGIERAVMRRRVGAVLAILLVVLGVRWAVLSARREMPADDAQEVARQPAPHAVPAAAGGTLVGRPSGQAQVLAYDPVDPPGTLRLEGRVVDAQEQPIAGIAVTLSSSPRRTVATEDDGSFVFVGLLPQLYHLYARGDAGLAGPHSVQLLATTEPITLVLQPGGELEFSVISTGGKPISNAAISLTQTSPFLGRVFTANAPTDAQGKAVIHAVPLGHISYDVVAESYASARLEHTMATRLRRQVRVELAPADMVHGVALQASGAPAPETCIAPFIDLPCETISNAAGAFVVHAAGGYSAGAITARHPMYGVGVLQAGQGNGTAGNPYLIRFAPNREVQGRVVTESGQPVAGALVRYGTKFEMSAPPDAPGGDEFLKMMGGLMRDAYFPADGVALTDLAGVFSLPLPPEGVFGVVAYTDAQTSNVVDIADAIPAPIELRMQATETAEIRGRVLHSSGEPADGAQVSAVPTKVDPAGKRDVSGRAAFSIRGQVVTMTNADGEFVLGGLVPDTYDVTAIEATYVAQRYPVAKQRVAAGAGDLVLTLPQTGSLALAVRDATSQPVARFGAKVHIAGGGTTRIFVWGDNAEGRMVIDGVPVGTHTVEVTSNGYVSRTITATIAAGQIAELAILTLQSVSF